MTSVIKGLAGAITISRPNRSDGKNVIAIRITDQSSRVGFLDMEMDVADFGKAITGLACMPVTMNTRGLEHVGLVKEREPGRVEVSRSELKSFGYSSDKDELSQYLVLHHQREGWTLDPYLDSQHSVSYGSGSTEDRDSCTVIMNFHYYRYVKKEESTDNGSTGV